MPVDRLNANNGRPLKPTLASTRSSKTPITPRLAPSVASASSVQSARTGRVNVGSTPRVAVAPQDNLTTPVKSFLSNNITPRSSSRKSRVSAISPYSTPGTPSSVASSTRPVSGTDFGQSNPHGGQGINGWTGPGPRLAVGGNNINITPTPKPTMPGSYNQPASEVGGTRGGAMFFHASEARPQEAAAPPPKKAPAFFYVNGQQDDSSRTSSETPSPPLSSLGRLQSESQFFHADSIPEARGASPIIPQRPISASPEPWPNTPPPLNTPTLQPPSPARENTPLSYKKGVSQAMRPNLSRGPSALSIVSGSHASNGSFDPAMRRSSAASSMRFGHSKSVSLSSIDSVASPKTGTTNEQQQFTASPLSNERRVVSNGSLPEGAASAPNLPVELLSGLPSPALQTPSKTSSEPSMLERMNELAANARRERKVLDLEISNSSLLVINRSLEREVRKQKAEIRRFRRMSRAGRFSVDTVVSDPDGLCASGVNATGNLSDMSEADEEQYMTYGVEAEDETESSDESSLDEGTMSPNTLAERDAAHLEKDEKRLQLDLSKHRELLLDSQKMNQSLKRCMNWTEELIKEGQKALAYQVRVSDVKLGGRVLSTAEDDGEDSDEGESKGLLSPWMPTTRGIDPFEATSLPDSDRTDRDSGVDLDGLKSLPPELREYISPLGSPMTETPPRPRLS
ncbi:hypothetical protein K504DRAFT_390998 [Pleomassaria siparia CBS 279.74]|uniref:Uncharacterized protein n=1 Tax=Pleomassaria siparia CBS 279.74 TaxID=1314801 RepID=A0A6G1JUK3_9PLEO|nr:hypothetical protein K504DRAFT_390998 [Pleomassaria siparia CBS 279.74]